MDGLSRSQANWYGELMVEVLERTKQRLINEEVEEEKRAGRTLAPSAPPQM